MANDVALLPPKGRTRQVMHGIVTGIAVSAAVAVVLMAATTMLSLAARWSWLADLATHFRVQTAVGAASALAILLVAKRWKWSMAAAVLLVVNGAAVAPFYWPTNAAPQLSATYSVLTANVHVGNRDMTPLVQLLRRRRPDVVFLVEVHPAAVAQLEGLDDLYPYHVLQPRSDAFGYALFSRRPITSQQTEQCTNAGPQTIAATIEFDGRDVVVIGTHPPPPVSSQLAQQRDRQLRAVGKLAAGRQGPLILLGDLNTTSWSPVFQDLLTESGLRDSRVGFGPQPSWPNLPWACRIPIDHILVTRDVRTVSREVGPGVGSDHLPILATFFFDD